MSNCITCPKDANHEVVENEASGKKFYYCRGCKDEVQPEPKKEDSLWWNYSTVYTTIPTTPNVVLNSVKRGSLACWTFSGCNDLTCDFCNPKGVV